LDVTEPKIERDHPDRKVVLGKIVGAFGVLGWVKVESFTDPIDNILDYPVWQLSDGAGWKPSKLLAGRVTSKGVQAQLETIEDRTAAERTRGVLIAVARNELPKPAAGQHYWDDLIGLDAYSPAGELLGTIEEIRATAAHALLSIAGTFDGKRIEHLVPLVSERLLKVDLPARRATVDWEGSWS
jgi:16S rRNA processing protein RimM